MWTYVGIVVLAVREKKRLGTDVTANSTSITQRSHAQNDIICWVIDFFRDALTTSTWATMLSRGDPGEVRWVRTNPPLRDRDAL